jgi:hypothetical protein
MVLGEAVIVDDHEVVGNVLVQPEDGHHDPLGRAAGAMDLTKNGEGACYFFIP